MGQAVLAVTREVLSAYAAGPDRPATLADRTGVAILSRLATHPGALAAAIRGGSSHAGGPGLFSGTAGMLAGLTFAADLDPGLAAATPAVRESLFALTRRRPWRSERVRWRDYDLAWGPAGIVMALASDRACPPEFLVPAARHLAGLCGPGLEGLCTEDTGRINTGLAHGAAGVAASLLAAGAWPELRRVCEWLMTVSHVDEQGIIAWPPVTLDGTDREAGRQAWCYGTPGVAWVLWDSARALDDPDLRKFADEAMLSFCLAFDPGIHLPAGAPGEALAVCHGAAGLLAIADSFGRHAGLAEAAELADWLEDHLIARLDQVRDLARTMLGLQAGAGGILAALITRQGGDRGWLPLLALR